MSETQEIPEKRFTASRTSGEALGFGWRDVADRIAGTDRDLASEVVRLGGGLDQIDRDLIARLRCLQHRIDGTGPCEGCEGWGATGNPYLVSVTAEVCQLADDRDNLLGEFKAVLQQARHLIDGTSRPTIHFDS
jgi:hypothetical protein